MSSFTKKQIAIDSELLKQLEEIALLNFDAKIHRVTKRPEITKALNEIIRIGLANFSASEVLTSPSSNGNFNCSKEIKDLNDKFNNLNKDLVERIDTLTDRVNLYTSRVFGSVKEPLTKDNVKLLLESSI